MIDYYRDAATALLPHIRGRPLTLGRFPSGVAGRGFAQTECRGHPDWMPTHAVRTAGGERRRHCVVDDLASLIWVANQNAIELHAFLARAGDRERPGAVVFDLDPGPGTDLVNCARAALHLRELLAGLGLAAMAKSSGGTGLHVFAPLDGRSTYATSKVFARDIAHRLGGAHPRWITAAPRGQRAGKVLVDWVQNSRGRTTVCPYSLRAADRPVVSAPVRWEEVERALNERRPELLVFGPRQLVTRLEGLGDPFQPVLELRQPLPR